MKPKDIFLRLLLGPFFYRQDARLLAFLLLLAVVLLTLVTQVGGIILWLSLPGLSAVYGRLRPRGRVLAGSAVIASFLALYLAVSLALVPAMAGHFGRRPLPCLATAELPLQAHSPLFCLANRHYARPAVERLLTALARAMAASFPGSRVRYLDAGFPFWDGFPLLPHLSHDDGRKVDLAFFWMDADSGEPVAPPSPLGYWAFAQPASGEKRPCVYAKHWLRWDFDWLQPLFQSSKFDLVRTRALLEWLQREGGGHALEKVLLEFHLRERMGFERGVIRFQGCRAARHDDHIHVQVR